MYVKPNPQASSSDAPADTAAAHRALAQVQPLAIHLGMAALVAAGLHHREIARQLYISDRTAQNHGQATGSCDVDGVVDLLGRVVPTSSWHRRAAMRSGAFS